METCDIYPAGEGRAGILKCWISSSKTTASTRVRTEAGSRASSFKKRARITDLPVHAWVSAR